MRDGMRVIYFNKSVGQGGISPLTEHAASPFRHRRTRDLPICTGRPWAIPWRTERGLAGRIGPPALPIGPSRWPIILLQAGRRQIMSATFGALAAGPVCRAPPGCWVGPGRPAEHVEEEEGRRDDDNRYARWPPELNQLLLDRGATGRAWRPSRRGSEGAPMLAGASTSGR